MELEELDFGQPEDNYTFNHVIALGSNANKMLRHLELDLGSWFENELLTIKEGHEEVRNLIAIVDNDISLFDVPERYTANSDFITHNIIVLDIGIRPQKKDWIGVFSYLWIPAKGQYSTVRYFFQMYYHDALSMSSLICFDFNDWKHSVRGQNKLTIYKLHLDKDAGHRLRKWPLDSFPNGKYLVFIGSDSFNKEYMDKLMKSVNNLFNRFADDAILHCTILGKELPEQESYIALMQFEPL